MSVYFEFKLHRRFKPSPLNFTWAQIKERRAAEVSVLTPHQEIKTHFSLSQSHQSQTAWHCVWPNVHQSGVSAFISIMQCWSFPIQHAHSFMLANTQNNFIHPFSHSQIPSLRQTHINKLKEEELFPHMSIFAAFLPNQPISQTVMLCVRLTGNYLSPIFLSFPLIPFFHSSCFALSWPLTPQQWEHSVCVDRYSLSLDCCLRPLAPYRPRKLLYSVIFFLFPECTVVECKLTWCLHVHFREIVLDYLPAKPHCLVFSFHNFLINFTYFKELRRKAVQATDRPTC